MFGDADISILFVKNHHVYSTEYVHRMNYTMTLQGYDGSTTVIPIDNAITIATLIQRYKEQTGHGGYIELLDMDLPTEHPVDHAKVIHTNKTFLVQKSVYEAIPDKNTLHQLVDHYYDDDESTAIEDEDSVDEDSAIEDSAIEDMSAMVQLNIGIFLSSPI